MPPDDPLDFELLKPLDEGPGPALPRAPAKLQSDAVRAVDKALPVRTRWRPHRIRPVWIVAAIVVPGVCAALVVVRPWPTSSPSAAAVSGSTSAAARGSLTELRATGSKATEAAPASEDQVPKPARPRPQQAATLRPSESKPASDSAEARAAKPARAATRKASAADSLKAANQLRGQGRWREAAQAYSQIARRYPGSAQGSVAALAAAALHLEHLGDPKTALTYYQRSLRAAGLSAEAQYGIANCHRALGHRQAELRALERLVEQFPGGLYSERAQRRLRALQEDAL